MENKSKSQVPIEETPEVKSFIYQQIIDFEPFLTPSSHVAVTAKKNNTINSNNGTSKVHCVLISIKENGVHLQEEGKSENIYEAILNAKNKLYQKLLSIQDSIISERERLTQIRIAQGNGGQIH